MSTKYPLIKSLTLMFLLLSTTLFAEISDDEKINILTDYLVKQENKNVEQARNEAIASVYGKPIFSQLSYDNDTEMFFGRVTSSKGTNSKLVNFYMPRKRAISFKKNRDSASIEVHHIYKDSEVILKDIELSYEGVSYPMAIKKDTSMSLKLGAYFISNQDTEIYAEKNGIGSSIDLQDLFNLKESTQAFRIDFDYAFNQKHKIELSYYAIENSNTRTVDEFKFNGSSISGKIDLGFDTTIYKFTYIYSAYRTNKLELTTRFGIHLTEFSIGLNTVRTVNNVTTSTNAVSLSLPAPLPVFGLGLKYDITDDLSLKYHVDYFYLSIGVDGSMIDNQLELEYMVNDYIGIGIGLNTTKMDFNAKIDKTTFGLGYDISGFIGSVIFRY